MRFKCLLSILFLAFVSVLQAGTAQTISFPEISNQLTTGGPVTLSATASSGLAVSYSVVSSGGVAAVSGNTLTLTGVPGSVTVKASQSGEGDFDPASDSYRSFVVTVASPQFVKFAKGSGASHTMGIRIDGTLWAWGDNEYGQLGDGTTLNRSNSLQIGSATNWSSVACGEYHTAAVRADGTLWAWGRNNYGQLGDGTTVSRFVPVRIGSATNWAFVACGNNHTVAVRSDGTLWAWGFNFYGQLGDNSGGNRISPVQIGSATNWQSVACGESHTVAVRSDGTLWAWGYNYYGQMGDGTTVSRTIPIQIGTANDWSSAACGEYHTVAVRKDGTLWAWGRNDYCQVGDGSTANRNSPVKISIATDWATVVCGYHHSVALRADGTLWAWGNNYTGQLGVGGRADCASPEQIGSVTDWVSIGCGSYHTVAVRADGTLSVWGNSDSGQVGDGNSTSRFSPVQSTGPVIWASTSCGGYHTAAVRMDGTLWAWGYNYYGQLGDGSTIPARSPFQIGNGTNWASVACGEFHTAAVRADGTLWAWGRNEYGQVGDGTTTNRSNPVQIGSDTNWTSVACGYGHTAAVRSDGTLWSWGNNGLGQSGDGTNTNRSNPVQVGTATNWASVSCGNDFTVAVRLDGTLWAWGYNYYGQVGDGTTTNRNSPVQIGTATNWVSVACGGFHTAAVRADGTLWAWGSNINGQLGDGTKIVRYSPVQIGSATNWASATCGEYHAAAVRLDGTLWAWGSNNDGELGDGTNTQRLIPVQIGSGTGWASVPKGLGRFHSAILAIDGSLWTCGNRNFGALGLGEFFTPANRIWPARGIQSLTWEALPNLKTGQQVTLSASCGSGLPVQYRVFGPATLSGNTLTTTGFGTVKVLAYQLGDAAWLSTEPMGQTLSVSRCEIAIEDPEGMNLADGSASIDFGVVLVGNSATKTFTIKNTGTENLILGAFIKDGSHAGEFAVSAPGSTNVIPGASTTFSVTYTPGGGGARSAALHIVNNDIESPFDLSFTGMGNLRPTLSLPASPLIVETPYTSGTSVSFTVTANDAEDGALSPNVSPVSGSHFVLGDTQVSVNATDSNGATVNGSFIVRVLYSTAQKISFPEIGNQLSTTGSVTLNATTNGALPVTYSVVSSGGVATVSGNTLTLTGVLGSVTVKASQPGNGVYDPAQDVYQTFVVFEGSQRFVKIAKGCNSSHSAGIRADGTLWAWGYNYYGQVGDGTNRSNSNRNSPVQIGAATNWVSVACGYGHTVAVRADGTLWGWGFNAYGQLGDGTTTEQSIPVQIGSATNWASVACGREFTIAVRVDGTLWAWGYNSEGQLGDGTTTDRNSPVQIGSATNWASVACGDRHTVAVRADGTLWAWGLNFSGQLGDGSTTKRVSPVKIGTSSNWASVACGDEFTVATRADGTLWTWGDNFSGQLGDGTTTDRSSPVQVGSDTNWESVACGEEYAVGTRSDGTLWVWGDNANGQLGDGSTTDRKSPVQLEGATNWESVGCGAFHTVAIREDGSLRTWGSNSYGQLGDGDISRRFTLVKTASVANWSSVACSGEHMVGARADGTLWAWGNNDKGQLGDGTNTGRSTPVQIGSATNWVSVACGDIHTVAVRADGTLWAWGSNSDGGLGDGTGTQKNSPVQIGTDTNWIFAACGERHTVAVRSDGTLWAWGYNGFGQLGNGTSISLYSPVQIGSATNWSSVACGEYHTAAVRADGTLWAWGYNSNGQLGDGTTGQRTSPVQIGSGTNWVSVGCSEMHTVAVRSDGTLWTWGDNTFGQLGDGTITSRLSPVQVGNGTGWTVAPKAQCNSRSAVLASDGSLWTCGDRSKGGLGWFNPSENRIWPARGAQTLTWGSLPNLKLGQQLTLSATSESGLPIRYRVSGPATLVGNTITAIGSGTVKVLAYQAGDSNWLNTEPIRQSLFVSECEIAIEDSEGMNLADGVASIDFGFVTVDSGTTKTFTIKNTGTENLILGAFTKDGSNPGEFTVSAPGTNIVAPGSSTTFSVTFSPTVRGARSAALHIVNNDDESPFDIAFTGTGNMRPMLSLPASPMIVETPYTSGTTVNFAVSANDTEDGTLTPISSPASGSHFALGDTLVSVSATDSNGATVSESFIVRVQYSTAQTINFPEIGNQFSTTGSVALNATTNGGLPVTYSVVSSGGLATVSGNTLTLSGVPGSVTVKASQPGNGVYDPAQDVYRTFVVVDASQRFVKIAKGSSASHAMGIRVDGTLWGWGANANAQLGDGTTILRNSPVKIGTATNWASVACGGSHTVAVRADGTLWAWGSNINGQLGDGTTTQRNTPVQIGSATNWVAVTCGENHTAGVRADGTLWTWGYNSNGQLGDGSTTNRTSPVQIGTATNWASAACGGNHTVAVRTDGTLWAWGYNFYGQLGDGTSISRNNPAQIGSAINWTSVASGENHAVAVRADGTLWAWGYNFYGQLGDGTKVQRTVPVQIGSAANWASVACGEDHTVAMRADASLWAWGSNADGQLGDGSSTNSSSPLQIGSATDWDFVACGSNYTAAIRVDGALKTWGSNIDGELGDGSITGRPRPVQIGSDTKSAAVACGEYHTVVVRMDGSLWSSGSNFYGQLGDGSVTNCASPVQIGSDTNWLSVACGNRHTMAVRTDGTLWAWGSNTNGQLGDSTTTQRINPVKIGAGTNWASVACGGSHTVAVRTDGTLWAWGYNGFSQLGDGTNAQRNSPVKIGTATNWTSVSCGASHTVAVRADGTLWAWGFNFYGQLGDGTTTQRNGPVKIGTATNWVSVTCGYYHTMAIRSDGTLWAWGNNGSGRLGDGTTTQRTNPVQIGNANDWMSVACGTTHSMGVRSDGTLWAWGANAFGQLGDGTTIFRTSPMQVGNCTAWSSVPKTLGASRSIAMTKDGTQWTWGNSSYGALGWLDVQSPTHRIWPERGAQSLIWGALPNLKVGQQITLSATSGSGLPVAYSVSGPATLNGNTLTTTASGTVHVLAWQVGDSAWLSTGPTSQTLTVSNSEIVIEESGGADLTDGASSIAFGSVLLGNSSPVKTFTIRNTGTENLLLGVITNLGNSPDDFAVGAPGAATVTPGGSTTFTVTFVPKESGTRSTVLRIASNDSDESPFDLVLTGKGNIAPTLSVPESPVIAEATSPSGANVQFAVTANDAEDGELSPNVSHASGSVFPLGDTLVSVSAVDGDGITVNGNFTVRVQDTTAPQISAPVDGFALTALITAAGSPIVSLPNYTGQAVTSDNVKVTVIAQWPLAGTVVTSGVTMVTLTASDDSGRKARVSFPVTVTLGELALDVALNGEDDALFAGDGAIASLSWPGVNGVLAKVRSGVPARLSSALVGGLSNGARNVVAQTGVTPTNLNGVTVKEIKSFGGNPGGPTYFVAVLQGNGITSRTAAALCLGSGVGEVQVLAQSGLTGTGLDGITIKSFGALDGNGSAAFFLATLQSQGVTPPVTSRNAAALCSATSDGLIRVLLRKGDWIDGKMVATIGTLIGSKGTLAEGRWRIDDTTIGVRLTYNDKSQAIWSIPATASGPEDWTLLAESGSKVSGFSMLGFDGPAFGTGGAASLVTLGSDAGTVPLNKKKGLVGSLGGSPTLLARQGDPAPGADGADLGEGIVFKTMSDPVVGHAGKIAFIGQLAGKGIGPKNGSGIWYSADGLAPKLLARTGDVAVGTGGRWAKIDSLALPDGGQSGVLFSAALAISKADGVTTRNQRGLWGTDSAGTLRLLLRTEDEWTIQDSKLKIRNLSVLTPIARASGAAAGYDGIRHVNALVTFENGSQAIIRVTLP